ncbi:uncharacterized protein LTR77_008340 [Saxophila tyrrhenica]|uniref:DUF3669 domain-containing protein n=1 Tax=Saxophila tyrrhenica TaxID=1690608 RepID=A0AAV9P2L1_9PEZI|nr:hypothetical protein LTR77_008340 [Saxophila tyrrhenica]
MQSLALYREIGHGHCGSVWIQEEEGTVVIKREDGGPGRSIQKDAEMHQRIEKSLTVAAILHLNIPAHYRLIDATDVEFWNKTLPRFPHDTTHHYEPCAALVSERIQPFSKAYRENLIDTYCVEGVRSKIKCSKSDEDCLIRPYLGRRSHNQRPSRFFTLRNRPFNLDQMEGIGLPTHEYAKTMAHALATIYWDAKIDANDVEFVLAPAGTHPGSKTWSSNLLGEHATWILDFDCCNSISLDEAGINQAATAFYKNDPFYPRPASDNEAAIALWGIFKSHFIESSKPILGPDSTLPLMMIERLERMGEERRETVRRLNPES